MRPVFFIASALATICALPAQQPKTVIANVAVIQPVSAGTATFSVQFLDANASSTLDTALGVLKDTGVAASHLTAISVSVSQGFIVTQYDFTYAVPAAEFTSTRDKLIAAQRSLQSVTTQGLGWTTAYSATAEDKKGALQQALPDLLARAREQAEVLASAIGLHVGTVQSVAAPAITESGLSLSVGLSVTYTVE